MGNPLLTFWTRRTRVEEEERRARRARLLAAAASANKASETVFLVLRRMRAPLIVLITIFAVVYALGSPVLIAATGCLERRRLLVGALCLFALSNAVAAFAPPFLWLLGARGSPLAGPRY